MPPTPKQKHLAPPRKLVLPSATNGGSRLSDQVSDSPAVSLDSGAKGAGPLGLDSQRAEASVEKIMLLHSRAIEMITQGTQWLSAPDIGKLIPGQAKDPAAAVRRWRRQGRIFSAHLGLVALYPRYGFSSDFTPVPALQEILKVLSTLSPLSIAAWFESTSSFLSGARPRELLATEPARVLDAARNACLPCA